MQIDRRALYNSLRMNWIMDPTLEVETWQIEDYRSMPIDILFERLEEKNIHLNKDIFLVFAENVDTPEQLTEELLIDSAQENALRDEIYLIVFELWRRLLPEKPSLSIFCDELDYQIHLYDQGQTDNAEAIQDALANLQMVLDENTDEGADPQEVFETLNSGCANDVESFLYDFISEQIDNQNISYASELLDGFEDYIKEAKWFDFLRARILSVNDPEGSNELITRLIQKAINKPNLEFNLELLSFMVQGGDRPLFIKLVKQSTKILENEQDFQDLLSVCTDFYHCLDNEQTEQAIQNILKRRSHHDLEKPFKPTDSHLAEFLKVLT